jgi:hypothetical protein
VEPELAELAQSAGLTVVTLMATDAWQLTREGLVSWWRRVLPERADAVAAELDATRADLIADPRAEGELAAEWQGRLRRLLVNRPEVAEELRRLLEVLAPTGTSGPAASGRVASQRAIASGDARIYQAGRDQHINEGPTNR